MHLKDVLKSLRVDLGKSKLSFYIAVQHRLSHLAHRIYFGHPCMNQIHAKYLASLILLLLLDIGGKFYPSHVSAYHENIKNGLLSFFELY